MKNKFRCLIAAALTAALLCGCAASPAQAIADLAGTQAAREDAQAEYLSFDDMEYVRPGTDELTADVAAVEQAIADGMETGELTELLDRCYAGYYEFSTMYTLAEIRYLRDMSDEFYSQEYSWCGDNFASVQQLMERMYVACAASPAADEHEDEYFWEGFVEEYGGDDSLRYSDRAVELMQRESELLGEYYALTASPTITIDGEEADYAGYLAGADGEAYSAARMEYYRQYNGRFAQIYMELVRTRKAIAEEMGYDSYEQMRYTSFERDYTPEQAAAYLEDIRTYIVPLYREVMTGDPYAGVDYSYMSADRLLDVMGAVAESMGGDAAEAFDFMRSYGLYDVERGENKANMSFTVYLDSYDEPFLFVTPYCDTEDILTLSHEFGHYLDAYVNYNAYESLDLSECFSQAMEYVTLGACGGVIDGDEYESLRLIKILGTLELYTSQASFAEFESRVYAMSDDELSADALNRLSLQLANDYGYNDGANDEYYALSWFDITHFFESPFYVISYPVSNDAAIQIYELEQNSPGAGLEKYLELLPRNYETLIESLEAAGLESPFAAGRICRVADTLHTELAAAGLAAAA